MHHHCKKTQIHHYYTWCCSKYSRGRNDLGSVRSFGISSWVHSNSATLRRLKNRPTSERSLTILPFITFTLRLSPMLVATSVSWCGSSLPGTLVSDSLGSSHLDSAPQCLLAGLSSRVFLAWPLVWHLQPGTCTRDLPRMTYLPLSFFRLHWIPGWIGVVEGRWAHFESEVGWGTMGCFIRSTTFYPPVLYLR